MQGCYIVLLQSIGKILGSLISDMIPVKVECRECLCGNKKNERFDEKIEILHYFVGEQWQDIALLVDRSDWSRDTVW